MLEALFQQKSKAPVFVHSCGYRTVLVVLENFRTNSEEANSIKVHF